MQRSREVLGRISSVLGCHGDANIAEELGVQRTTVSSWKSRDKIPYEECWQVAQKTGISMDWLLSGTGQKERNQNLVASKSGEVSYQHELPDGVVGIPLLDIAASAGGGTIVEDENVADLIFFDEVWLWQAYGLRPRNLRIFQISGNSMEPTLRAGEMVLIDLSHTNEQRPSDGIYVIRLEGGVLVKQLQSLPGGRIKVSSENEAYDPFTIDLKEEGIDFVILGRVMINLRNV